jgi:hypothetical protein
MFNYVLIKNLIKSQLLCQLSYAPHRGADIAKAVGLVDGFP